MSENLSQELWDKRVEKAMDHERKFAPSRNIAYDVADTAHVLIEDIRRGATWRILMDIQELEAKLEKLKELLR